jgi:competence protein ComEA
MTLAALDPGRSGLRVLAAVAAVVGVGAAVLAWAGRPDVEPVPGAGPPVASVPAAVDPGGAVGVTGAAGGTAAPAPSGAVIVVAVTGRVRRPGLVRLPAGARVADALDAAGGVLPGTDIAFLNLARRVADGELVVVGLTPPPGVAPSGDGAVGEAPGGGPVNLNTAGLVELQTLPGVGPVLAQRILDYRQAHGGFRSVADLRQVSGIGDARFAQLKDLVTV